MKLVKKDVQVVDMGYVAGSEVTLTLYLGTASSVWRFIRGNLRVAIAITVSWQVKNLLGAQLSGMET